MKRVLVTGARGFIGRRCLPRLAAAGYEIHAVTSQPVPGSERGLEWHRVDIFDAPAVRALIRKILPSHLLHLAWVTEPGKYWTSPENLRWVAASLELLHAFREAKGARVVVAGTCAEYDWNFGVCSETNTPLASATLYGVSKHALSAILDSFSAQTGLSAAWGRVFFPYGPGEHPSKLVSSVINALLAGRPAPCSSGEQQRDFLHVDDAAGAFVALLDSGVTGAVNIGSGKATPVKDVVLAIADLLGRPDLVQLGALPATAEPPLVVAEVRRLREEVGWRPSISLDSGLHSTIVWWRERASRAQEQKELP